MSETGQEYEVVWGVGLTKLDPAYGEPTTPVEAPADTTATDADGDPVVAFTVDGTFEAEDQHDAYKLLQAHFLELSRTGSGTISGVSVSKA